MDVLGLERRETFGRRSDTQVGLLLFSLVSLILLLSSLYSAEASVFKKARESALEAASPILTALAGPIGWINDRVGDFGDYFRVLEQNKALREENAALRQWEDEARSLRAVVAALEDLDVYQAPPNATPINAFVIGESNEAYAHSMIVNAGAEDGVMRGLAAVDERGMIGRIVDVSDNAARILLLNDIQSRIPVFVEGSFVEGLLVGRSTSNPSIAITMLANGDKIEPGQRVVSSGAGGVLPRGLTIGAVSKIDDGEAIVDLAADYARTRIVRIINYDFPQVDANAATAPPPVEEMKTPAKTETASSPATPRDEPPREPERVVVESSTAPASVIERPDAPAAAPDQTVAPAQAVVEPTIALDPVAAQETPARAPTVADDAPQPVSASATVQEEQDAAAVSVPDEGD